MYWLKFSLHLQAQLHQAAWSTVPGNTVLFHLAYLCVGSIHLRLFYHDTKIVVGSKLTSLYQKPLLKKFSFPKNNCFTIGSHCVWLRPGTGPYSNPLVTREHRVHFASPKFCGFSWTGDRINISKTLRSGNREEDHWLLLENQEAFTSRSGNICWAGRKNRGLPQSRNDSWPSWLPQLTEVLVVTLRKTTYFLGVYYTYPYKLILHSWHVENLSSLLSPTQKAELGSVVWNLLSMGFPESGIFSRTDTLPSALRSTLHALVLSRFCTYTSLSADLLREGPLSEAHFKCRRPRVA